MTRIPIEMIWRIFLSALIGYVTLLLIVFIFQRKLLYFPSEFRLSEERDRIDYLFSNNFQMAYFLIN